MVRVIVAKWCSRPSSKHCLLGILSDLGEIEAAAATEPYTSPKLMIDDAKALCSCINRCGGEAKIQEL